MTKTGTQSLTKIISHSHSNSSLLSANMGLTITPYRIQTPINSNLNQRPHMRTPLRSLITPMSFESPQSLQINTRNTKLERQHISRSLTTEDIRRLNLVLRQDRSISTNAFPYQRSRSNVK